MMNLLRDTSANIQFEAFHVFKVFVANPKKPEAISQILVNNREKLIAYLRNFQNNKGITLPLVEMCHTVFSLSCVMQMQRILSSLRRKRY